MRSCLFAVVALFWAHAEANAQVATRCGRERWPVKVAVDRDASDIKTDVVPTTVQKLVQIPRPIPPFPYNRRLGPYERTTYRVVVWLREVLPQDDSDLHLVLADTANPAVTIVGEIPDSACALGSVYAGSYKTARRALRAAPIGALIEVDGVGFFDYIHGQRGMARNGFELHPIVALRVIAGAVAVDGTRDARVTQFSSDSAKRTEAARVKVWVNTGSNVYHCPGTRWYGATKAGYYSSQQEAKAAGARPAYGWACLK